MKRMILLAAFIGFSLLSEAQIVRASLQASGLTCAMCARSVYKGLETLPFIGQIDTDLDKSSFLLVFKPGVQVDVDQIRKKVEDAGFSVAALRLDMVFNGQQVRNDSHLDLDGRVYHFLGVQDQVLSGEKSILLVDKSFLAAKDQKRYSGATRMACYKSGLAGDCCAKEGVSAGTRVYHVSM